MLTSNVPFIKSAHCSDLFCSLNCLSSLIRLVDQGLLSVFYHNISQRKCDLEPKKTSKGIFEKIMNGLIGDETR